MAPWSCSPSGGPVALHLQALRTHCVSRGGSPARLCLRHSAGFLVDQQQSAPCPAQASCVLLSSALQVPGPAPVAPGLPNNPAPKERHFCSATEFPTLYPLAMLPCAHLWSGWRTSGSLSWCCSARSSCRKGTWWKDQRTKDTLWAGNVVLQASERAGVLLHAAHLPVTEAHLPSRYTCCLRVFRKDRFLREAELSQCF